MGILQTLKVTAATRSRNADPVVHRRNRILSSLFLQIKAASAAVEGKRLTIPKTKKFRDSLSGAVTEVQKEVPVRETWWLSDGKVYLELRYGHKPLEFAKGKNAIELDSITALVPTLEKLKQAVTNGEFDTQLADKANRLTEQLKAKRAAKK